MTDTDADQDETAQQTLVPLSEEELKAAGAKLARQIRQLEQMEAEHTEIRAEQREERKTLRKQISALASVVRNQGR